MRVLVVGGDPTESGALIEILGQAGMKVATAYGTLAARRLRSEESPDVVVVGAGLNARDLYGFISDFHSRIDVPMLVLGSWREDARVAAVLDAGADDVAMAPCGRLELVARIRALARRWPSRAPADVQFGAAGLRLDPAKREVSIQGRPLNITPIEFALLASLASQEGGVVARRHLLRAGWPLRGDVEPGLLRTHLANLNRKLLGAGHPGIRNEPRSGYALRLSS
jgi:DNA-binding response OmpR family regulator